MPEPPCCNRVAQRLAHHGMPPSRIQRITQELADHWGDLRAAGMRDGLTHAEAEAQADARLGDPDQLAAKLIESARQTSWLGRHPVIALCVLPPLLAPLLMAIVAFPLIMLDQWIQFTHWGAEGNRPNPYVVTSTLWCLHYSAMIASLCWLGFRAWNTGLGRKWVLAFCVWCALFALLRYFDADPIKRNVVISLTFPWRLNAHTAIVLLVHGLAAAGFLLGVKATRKLNFENTKTNGLV